MGGCARNRLCTHALFTGARIYVRELSHADKTDGRTRARANSEVYKVDARRRRVFVGSAQPRTADGGNGGAPRSSPRVPGGRWGPPETTLRFANLGTLPERAYRPCDVVTFCVSSLSLSRRAWRMFERPRARSLPHGPTFYRS